jgi:hypothetical protein
LLTCQDFAFSEVTHFGLTLVLAALFEARIVAQYLHTDPHFTLRSFEAFLQATLRIAKISEVEENRSLKMKQIPPKKNPK